MKEYQGFAISNFRTGFDEAVEPWLLPRDAFQVLTNAHLYRGIVEKINGYDIFAKMSYRTTIQMTGVIDGANKTFTATLPSALTSDNISAQATITTSPGVNEVFSYSSDASATVLNLTSTLGGTGTIDISNPSSPMVTLNFNTAPANNTAGGVQYNAVIFTYDTIPSSYQPIMGIKPYYQDSGAQDILVFDTKRAGKIVAITSLDIGELYSQNNAVSEIPHQVQAAAISTTPAFNGVATVFTGTLATHPVVPGTVTFTYYDNTGALLDTATDALNQSGELAGGAIMHGYINYYTGQWTLGFTGAPAATSTLNASVCAYGDTFTGTFSNFFSVVNCYGTQGGVSVKIAVITNNVDAIRYYDGMCLKYLNTNLSVKAANVITYDITKCLHVEFYRERLLLVSPTVTGIPVTNGIYWSVAGNALDFTNDEQLIATTSEPIKTYKIINTDMIVRFSNSERVFRYTGDAFSPFRWDSTNIIWACDAPYSAINYDSWFSSVGKPAIVGSDGVNIKRVDEIIPDFTDPYRISQQIPALFMDQTSIGQCYGERFDDLKEGWLCYRSAPSPTVSPSDSVLAFNYLDSTYAVYTFPFSCLGFGTILNSPVWGNDFREWGSVEDTWDTFNLTKGSLTDLAGDQFGNVFELDVADTMGPEKTGTITNVTNASPAQITSASHGLDNGDQIVIQGVVGPDEINNQIFVVTVVDANNFTVPFDTTLLAPYDSGGNWFTAPVLMNVVSKNFNPFIEQGQLARFGYIDLFLSSNDNTTLRVQFYKDDQLDTTYNTYYQETPITLTANGQTKVWKRIYVGAVAKEHTIRFYQNPEDFSSTTLNQPVWLHAMVLYFKPAGRIFQ